MKRAVAGLIVAASVAGCGGGSSGGGGDNSKKAEADACRFVVVDATNGARQAVTDLQAGHGKFSSEDMTTTAKVLRQDVATLPAGDPLRVATEALATVDLAFAKALTANQDVKAAAAALEAPGNKVQSICRAVTPR